MKGVDLDFVKASIVGSANSVALGAKEKTLVKIAGAFITFSAFGLLTPYTETTRHSRNLSRAVGVDTLRASAKLRLRDP